MSLHRFSIRFQKNCFGGAAAERFDAHGAGAGESVDEERTFDRRAENIEKRFAQAVAGRPEFQQARAFQYAAAIFTSDHTHDLIPLKPDDSVCATPD